MSEKVFDVEMIFIRNTSGSEYTVECLGRNHQDSIFKFSGVEGIEIQASPPMEVKNSYMQLGDSQEKMWNLKLAIPCTIHISFMGKIVIKVV